MRRMLRQIGFIILCAAAFFAAVSFSFMIGISAILGRAYAAWKTNWTDEVGVIYPDISLDPSEGTGYDLYIPANADKTKDQTLIVYIHGGGFTSGDKKDGEMLCKYFTSKGYFCASVNYPLNDGIHSPSFNQMYEKIWEQVELIRDKAEELGYRITEMATTGESAGGYLALLYAYRSAETSPIPVKLVFEMTGPVTFEPGAWGVTEEKDVLETITQKSGKKVTAEMMRNGEMDAIIREISPALLVDETTIPTVMAYGPKDKVVPAHLKYALLEALEKYGVDHAYIEFPHSGHAMAFDPEQTQVYVDTVNRYLEKYMDNH